MYVVLTVDNMYYDAPMYTFAIWDDAWKYACSLSGWWAVEIVR